MAMSRRVTGVALAFVLFLTAGGALQSAEPAKTNSNTVVEDRDGPVIGLVLEPNAASIRVLLKAGYAFEGMLDYEGFEVLQYARHRPSP